MSKCGVWIAGAALALGLSAPASAQLITSIGYVDRISDDGGGLVVRMADRMRHITVNPDAEVTINGRPAELSDISYNARVRIMSWQDRANRLHANVVRVEQPFTATRRAGIAPGTVISGTVAGLYPSESAVLLRTRVGFRQVNLGNAPVLLNGRAINLRDLALGDEIQVQQAYPPGGLIPLTALTVVTTPQSVAGYRATFRSSGSAARAPMPSAPFSGNSNLLPGPVEPRF